MSGNGTASQAPPATARRRVLSIALWALQALLALEFAMSTGANFVTPAALAAARRRVASPEPHEMLAMSAWHG